MKRGLLGRVVGPDAGAEAELRCRWRGGSPRRCPPRGTARPPDRTTPRGRPATSAGHVGQHRGRVVVAGAIERRGRRSAARAPAATRRRAPARPALRGSRAWPADRVGGFVAWDRRCAATPWRRRSGARIRRRFAASTMNRLAAMQDWPLLMVRASTAVRHGAVEIGAGHHHEGVAAAQFEHRLLDLRGRLGGHLRAGRLAAGEGDGLDARVVRSRASTCAEPISSVWNTLRPGKPARRMTSSIASAHCGTLEACFSSPTLPAISAGAAKRKTCQKGNSTASPPAQAPTAGSGSTCGRLGPHLLRPAGARRSRHNSGSRAHT